MGTVGPENKQTNKNEIRLLISDWPKYSTLGSSVIFLQVTLYLPGVICNEILPELYEEKSKNRKNWVG